MAASMEDLVRAVNALGLNHEVARVRYQPEFPVRGRIYEGDEWSSESSDDYEDQEWLSIQAQLPPWIRNPGGGDGVSEEGVDAPPAAGVVMSGAGGSVAHCRALQNQGRPALSNRPGLRNHVRFLLSRGSCGKTGRVCSPKKFYLTSTRILYSVLL